MMAGLSLGLLMPAPASALDVVAGTPAPPPYPNLAPLPVYPSAEHVLLPQLPEPEVVAMMLLGLVLIGYRASRDSYEKFR